MLILLLLCSNVESASLSSSSPVENSDVSKREGKKKTKRKAKKKNNKKNVPTPNSDRHVGNSLAIDNSAKSVDFPTRTSRKPRFPCRLCKGDHLLKDCHGLS